MAVGYVVSKVAVSSEGHATLERAGRIAMGILTFVAIGLLRVPLLWALAMLAPLSIAIAWWIRR